jgi:hypothetical protein
VKKIITFSDDIWKVIMQYKKDFKFNDDAEAIRDLIRNDLISKGYLKIKAASDHEVKNEQKNNK